MVVACIVLIIGIAGQTFSENDISKNTFIIIRRKRLPVERFSSGKYIIKDLLLTAELKAGYG